MSFAVTCSTLHKNDITNSNKSNDNKNCSIEIIKKYAEKNVLKRCFFKWKQYAKDNNKMQKINNLVEEICKFKETSSKQEKENKIDRNKKSNECFKNRFQAQKSLIEKQKAKLRQQTQIIEDLKLGIIRDEISKTLENTKAQIRESYGKCSSATKLKVIPQIVDIDDTLMKFIVNSNKAPRLLQKMEERAYERARNREIILERKRLIDEEKKRLVQEAVEQKRVQDEEEKRKGLEAIKERRRLELELQKTRQANKEKFLAHLKIAEKFNKRKLLKFGFEGLKSNYVEAQENQIRSEVFFENLLKRNSFVVWKKYIEEKDRRENEKGDNFYGKKILRKMFDAWITFHIERIQMHQVAEDYCDLRLQRNHFVFWHRYVCIQYMQFEKKHKLAVNHYNSRILLQCFYQWRSLPAVLKLEKTKEERKKKWREKVWEILPDYRPPEED